MSNQNSFRASLFCSLVCSITSSFGAYLSYGLHTVVYRLDQNSMQTVQKCEIGTGGTQRSN